MSNELPNGPRVLVLDIETGPQMGYFWSLWKQNIGLNQRLSDTHLMSFAAKWLDQPEILYMDQSGEADVEDDTKLLSALWDLLDAAEFVITHHGKVFDLPKIKARMFLKGMKPFSPVKHLDTKAIASREFYFDSNKLEYLTDKVCKKHKKSKHQKFPGFELWAECRKGNPEAWAEMKDYNIGDITSLEELYKSIRGWDSRHPALFVGDGVCSRCGGKVAYRGYITTPSGMEYRRTRCTCCGGWGREPRTISSPEYRKQRIISQ